MFQETISAISEETLYKNRPSISSVLQKSDLIQNNLLLSAGALMPQMSGTKNFPAFYCIRCPLIKTYVMDKTLMVRLSMRQCAQSLEKFKRFLTTPFDKKKKNRNGLIWRLGLSASSASTTDEAITSCKYSPVSLFIYCTALPSNIELTSFAFFFCEI